MHGGSHYGELRGLTSVQPAARHGLLVQRQEAGHIAQVRQRHVGVRSICKTRNQSIVIKGNLCQRS